MQQRISSSSASRDSGEHRIIDIGHQPQAKQTSKIKMDEDDDDGMYELPLYDPKFQRRGFLRSRKKWIIHAIPVIVLLCFFALWWFSFPVNVIRKDGRIEEVIPIDTTKPVHDDTLFDQTLMAVVASPTSQFRLILPRKQ